MSPIEADDAGEADGVALPATAGDVAEGDEGGQEEAEEVGVEEEKGDEPVGPSAEPAAGGSAGDTGQAEEPN